MTAGTPTGAGRGAPSVDPVRDGDAMFESARTPALPRLADYPAHWARVRPDGDAVVEDRRVLSHAAFERAIDAASRALLAAGVGRGDRVATLATPSTEHLVHYLAAARIGAVWLGLNPRHRLDELAHVIGDAKPRLVAAMLDIEGRDYRGDFGALREGPLAGATTVSLRSSAPGFVPWERFLADGAAVSDAALAAAAAAVEPEDVALIVYTSGSTGRPKGAMLSQRAIVAAARIQCEHWWAEPFRILNNGPINHVGGAVQLAAQAIVAGGTNLLMDRFDPVALPAFVREWRVTVIHHVPTTFQMLLDKARPTRADLQSLQVLVWSGAAAPRPLIERLREFGPRLYTSYGQTETAGEVLYVPEGADVETLATSVGVPDPRIPLRLGREDGSGPADGDEGEIQVRGPTLASGYFRREDATGALWTADGWMRTGDVARRDADGSYRLTGRMKEMFKSGGYNVYPREIELVLERHPGVAMAAVVRVPDAVYGEVGHAWVLACERAPEPGELEALCRAHLANYKIPKRFHVRRELPLLSIYKIDKKALARMALDAPAP